MPTESQKPDNSKEKEKREWRKAMGLSILVLGDFFGVVLAFGALGYGISVRFHFNPIVALPFLVAGLILAGYRLTRYVKTHF